MKYVYLALNWGFGVLFLLIGIVITIEDQLSGLSLILLSLLLLPPVRNFVHSNTKKELPLKIRGVAIFVLLIAFGIFSGQSQDRKAQEVAALEAQKNAKKIAAIQQKKIDYFNNNSFTILRQIRTTLNNANYKEVVSLSAKYLPSKNKELIDLYGEASSKLAAIASAEKMAKEKAERVLKTKEILANLRGIPASQYERNRNFYKQLVAYNPGVGKYKEKLSYYSIKAKEAKEIERIKNEQNKKERELQRLGLKWNYSEQQESMGRGTVKRAWVSSLNKVQFDFPYQGKQRATLSLRAHPKYGKDIILSVEKGQFLCGINSCKVSARFNTGKPKVYTAGGAADHTTTTLFISDFSRFLANTRKSKTVFVEALFFKEGERVFEFDVSGLKW